VGGRGRHMRRPCSWSASNVRLDILPWGRRGSGRRGFLGDGAVFVSEREDGQGGSVRRPGAHFGDFMARRIRAEPTRCFFFWVSWFFFFFFGVILFCFVFCFVLVVRLLFFFSVFFVLLCSGDDFDFFCVFFFSLFFFFLFLIFLFLYVLFVFGFVGVVLWMLFFVLWGFCLGVSLVGFFLF